MSNFKQSLEHITTFIFDVDGVLTDGTVTIMPDGEQIRKMSIRDGYALQLAVKMGYNVAIISGGRSESVRTRLNALGIEDVYLGANNKIDAYDTYVSRRSLHPEQILYMGDDIPDFEVMKRVGAATCPKDAAYEIQEICHYISDKIGGDGCARDVIEQVLKLHGKWMGKTAHHW